MRILDAKFRRKGSELHPDDQKHVLAAYVHRFTGEHKPEWAKHTRPDGKPYPVQFATDAEWLANTEFAVSRTGGLLYACKECFSTPTWPNNPELRNGQHATHRAS